MTTFTSAACKGQSYLFFAPFNERPNARKIREDKALALCAICPIRDACLSFACKTEAEYGIWGGQIIGL
jgi:WhiB family redox-sensing transcriptional regulator